jgi:divalent metal cation (Fe/Co/Zn/Cd) transporter
MRRPVLWAIVALAVGAVLVALGALAISESGPAKVVLESHFPGLGLVSGPRTVYTYSPTQLMTGIILTLAGTVMVSASLTYLLLERKRKGVCARPSIRSD